MWPRKQLDIGWRDFAFGLAHTLLPLKPPPDESMIGSDWIPPHEALVALSVRTGWDLLLATLQLPAGSEVILSAVTIPDMVRIIEHHGLVPVPVEVGAATLEPRLEAIERAISPRTRLILIAHLFGSRVEMTPIVDLARRYGLIVVEDCAQAFIGSEYAGHSGSHCSLFSFGPIKTSTALGGAVLRLRDAALRNQMLARQQSYPVQSRRAYAARLAKYALFRLLLFPRAYGMLVQAYCWLGIDYDRAFGNAAHSFGTADFFTKIRRQPSASLRHMLQRRITAFSHDGLRRLHCRATRGNQLARTLPAETVIGEDNPCQTYWVVPLSVANPREVVAALRTAGFDATSRCSLICAVPANASSQHEPRSSWLEEIIFIPNGHDMPDAEWQRMIDVLRDTVAAPQMDPCEPRVAEPVSVLT